jgi:hypothetical protein
MGYVIHNVIVEKSKNGRRVYLIDGYAGSGELWPKDLYVNPRLTS